MNEANTDSQLRVLLREACRTKIFDGYFRFVDKHIKNKLLPADYISKNNGTFMGKFFECWQSAQQHDLMSLKYTAMLPTHKSQYHRICNLIAATDIDFRHVCLIQASIEDLLFAACLMTGNAPFVRVLVEFTANINQTNQDGDTPLILALQRGHLEVVYALIEKGADVNKPTKKGLSPLLIALRNGHVEAALKLLEKGAHINSIDDMRYTSLHWASKESHIEAVRALLKKSANVNIGTDHDQTPLILASINGHIGIMSLLLEAGADTNKIDCFRSSAITIASKNGHIDAVRLLLEKGAKIPRGAKLCAQNSEIRELLEQTEKERAQRKQAATVFLGVGNKYKRGIFASEQLKHLPPDGIRLIGRMIKASSSAAA